MTFPSPSTDLILGLLLALIAQQLWIYFAHRRASNREELFRIITENAADMIALVDTKSHRLYNSPSYQRILGYSPAELAATPIFEQIHPDDRFKVLEAAREARATGIGKSLQYRLRHKNGEWRILESTASAIRNARGEVEKLVIVNRDVTQRVAAEEQLAHHALHDALTGLANRRLFVDRLQRCFAQTQREPAFGYSVLLIDVDAFKSLNHSMGSAAGDQVLTEVAFRLQQALRATDTISRPVDKAVGDIVLSRIGGDEFAILLEACVDPSDVLRIADRIHAALAAPLVLEQGPVQTRVSIGSALNTPQQSRAEDLLADAEAALRRAQAMGGNRTELFDSAMQTRAVTHLKLESDLRTALNRGEFRVLYQPVFQMDSLQIAGFEALLRWQHPAQGLISPAQFLDAAEDSGLMALIDQWVIREACRQLLRFEAERRPLHLAVNLSARHFTSPSFLDGIKACLHELSLRSGILQLGISQRVAMATPDLTTHVLSQLKRLEVITAIDDFGAGTLSLPMLRQFAVDIWKIDRTLITSMQAERAAGDVVELVCLLARKLNCQIVAQGIEKPAQLDRLRSLGCNLAQGYLFAPPLQPEAALRLLRQHRASRSAPAGSS
jgi:diguanylate cyclase (GGDEF)-like protein/PAS domain S-box-containing protein